MKFFGFIIGLAYSELLVQCSGSKNEYALVVRPQDTEYVFASVATTFLHYFSQYLSGQYNNKLYYLCPHGEDGTLLKIAEHVSANYSDEKRICEYAVEPSIYKVIDNMESGSKENIIMHKYGIGFTIDKRRSSNTLPEYELLNKKFYFLPMISVYVYANLKLTFAVSYAIITTDVKKKLENTTLTYKSTPLFPDKIEIFYNNQKEKLEEKLGLEYNAEKHALELGSLVNENDFIIDRWKKTARYKINQILIWKNNFEMWRDIQEYARHVGALSNSKTTITAGIGDVLTISDSKGEQYEMKWGEEEDTIFIPELYWLAIKHYEYEDKQTTGMVIIMHNEPTGGKNVKKICDKNPCIEEEKWFLTVKPEELENFVYCCELNKEILFELGIQNIHEKLNFYKGDSYGTFPPRWENDGPVNVNEANKLIF